MDARTLAIFASAGIAVVFTLVWIGVAAWTGIRYVRIKEGEPANKAALAVWLVSLGGVFTGPCAALFSLVGLVGGLWMWKRAAEAEERTRAAGVGAAASGAVSLAMILLMLLVLALGGVFTES